jgi:hypothetical protein
MSQQINLFNPNFLKKHNRFSSVTLVRALGVVLILVILYFGYLKFQSMRLDQDATQIGVQLNETQQQLTKTIAEYVPRKGNPALADELKLAQDEYAAIQLAMSRLQNNEFGNKKGYAAYMGAFARQKIDGLWLTGFSIVGAGNAIGIQGRALQPDLVPAFISRLQQEPVMQGKSFAVLEMQQPRPAGQSAQTGGKPLLPAPYIEFDLRSSGMDKAVAPPSETSATVAPPMASAPASATAASAASAAAARPAAAPSDAAGGVVK